MQGLACQQRLSTGQLPDPGRTHDLPLSSLLPVNCRGCVMMSLAATLLASDCCDGSRASCCTNGCCCCCRCVLTETSGAAVRVTCTGWPPAIVERHTKRVMKQPSTRRRRLCAFSVLLEQWGLTLACVVVGLCSSPGALQLLHPRYGDMLAVRWGLAGSACCSLQVCHRHSGPVQKDSLLRFVSSRPEHVCGE